MGVPLTPADTIRYANSETMAVNTKNHWVPIYQVRGAGPGSGDATLDYVDVGRALGGE